jgi:hypothetical protein
MYFFSIRPCMKLIMFYYVSCYSKTTNAVGHYKVHDITCTTMYFCLITVLKYTKLQLKLDVSHAEINILSIVMIHCRFYTHALRRALSRPPSSPPSFISHQPRTSVGLPHPDHIPSQGRDSPNAQHRDNDSHMPPSL